MCKDCNTGKIKLSFKEMVISGATGETSATGFCGVLLVLVSLLIFIGLFVLYIVNQGEAEHILQFIDKIIVILGIGSALLGTRKISGVIANNRGTNKDQTELIKAVEQIIEEREERDEKIVRRRLMYNDSSTAAQQPINETAE